ncbi:helix-turn-helix domain-containing protein [Paenibacillus sp. IB182496]|uniref:Helix-turn-helix domain-containing protein n=1 Tax=Paenibacillus sabuli TaxID=2772509 RepID=A0A927GR45_9BACL|nr:helix-turn-helix domain-containing protein [Paenibacillus sabuli]MBD2845219.1 helix-turn-helix domain-containing protein [Paenibacillus sabuli]
MSDLGELLKKAREEKGLSLEDIQDLTKIRKRYLEAIEEGNYKVLPGTFYVRAFVKNYAETVGLDSEEVLRLYNKEIPSPAGEPVVEPMMKPRTNGSSRISDRWSKWGFTLLMWCFLILIIVIIYMYAINRPDDGSNLVDDTTNIVENNQPPLADNNPPDTPDNAAPGDGGNEGPGQEPEQQEPEMPETTLTLIESSGATDLYELSPGGVHTYELKVTGSGSWNNIRKTDRNGENVHSSTDPGGTDFTYEIEGNVYINVGRADNVEIRVDGILLEDSNEPNSDKFQINVVEPTEGEAADAQ